MADLGSIGVAIKGIDYGTYPSSRISGTVTENGVAVAGAVVALLAPRLYGLSGTDPAGAIAAFPTAHRWEITASNGSFTFRNLRNASDLYTIIAFDPAGGVSYNAIVYDKVPAA